MSGMAIRRGVLVPAGLVVLAFLVVFYAGMLGSLGPLDRDTAFRVAIGLWVVAPVAGGGLVRSLEGRQVVLAAIALGTLVGIAVAFLYLTAAGTASLSSACAQMPHDGALYVLGCLIVGAIAGIGMAAGVAVTAALAARDRWLSAIVLGGGANFGLGMAAYALVYSVVTCLRP